MPLTRRLVPSRLDPRDVAFFGLGEHSWACHGAIPTGYVRYAFGRWTFVLLSRLALCLIVQVESAGKSTVCRHSAEAGLDPTQIGPSPMHEIICSHCSQALKIDEAGCADILIQHASV